MSYQIIWKMSNTKQMKDNKHLETDTTWLILIYVSHISSRNNGWSFMTGHSALILFNTFVYSAKLRSIVNLSNICHRRWFGFLWFFLHRNNKYSINFHWICSTFSGSWKLPRSAKESASVLAIKSHIKDVD